MQMTMQHDTLAKVQADRDQLQTMLARQGQITRDQIVEEARRDRDIAIEKYVDTGREGGGGGTQRQGYSNREVCRHRGWGGGSGRQGPTADHAGQAGADNSGTRLWRRRAGTGI